MTAVNIGVVEQITPNVPRTCTVQDFVVVTLVFKKILTLKVFWKKTLNAIGSLISIPIMSPENLLKILPDGVVSKNDMGKRITFFSTKLCNLAAAAILPKTLSL